MPCEDSRDLSSDQSRTVQMIKRFIGNLDYNGFFIEWCLFWSDSEGNTMVEYIHCAENDRFSIATGVDFVTEHLVI